MLKSNDLNCIPIHYIFLCNKSKAPYPISHFYHRFQRIAYDETLWKRIKMFHKTVFSGVVGQVLARGTCYLSLAKANLQTPVMRNQRFSHDLST